MKLPERGLALKSPATSAAKTTSEQRTGEFQDLERQVDPGCLGSHPQAQTRSLLFSLKGAYDRAEYDPLLSLPVFVDCSSVPPGAHRFFCACRVQGGRCGADVVHEPVYRGFSRGEVLSCVLVALLHMRSAAELVCCT